jgi:Zn-dependent M28 family amino/carboxypeptidase
MAFSQDATLAQRKQTKTKTPAVKHVGEFGNIEGVTARQLKDYLYFVASDEMEGRDTPSRGLDLTAKFIAMNLSRWGLKPAGTNESFFQKIPLYRKQLLPDQTSAAVNGQSFKIGEDFIAQLNEGEAGGRLVYVGHGMVIKSRNIDAYRGVDVKDKVLVAADAYPKGVTRADFRGKIGVDFDTPASYARAHGAKGVIVIPNSSALNFWEQRYKSSLNPSRPAPETAPNGGVPIIVASLKMVEAIFQGEKLNYEAIKKNMEEATLGEAFDLSPDKKAVFKVGVKTETLMTQNVVAVLEGGDPQLKDEYVAIGAHYDHVGVSSIGSGADKIFNGADDDGSGTVAALAIAEALAQGPKPKRSVLFVWHAGEEKGLWGSAYIADNPPVPIRQIITQLNIDMIGRSKKEGDTNPRNTSLTGPNEIYVIGSKMMSTELGEVSESVNKSFLNLKFNYKYDAPNDPERFFYRSDHYNYAKKGIPIIFYFSGVHEDYHQPTDHADKIDYAKMEKVTRTVLATLWKLANATDRPKVDKPLPPQLAGY